MNFYEAIGSGNHPIVIRQPHPAEQRHVQALQATVLPSQRPLSEILDRAHHPKTIQMAAFDGDKVVATVSLSPVPGHHYVYEVDRLVTLPQFRGQGIGKRILLEAEKLAKQHGATEVTLTAGKDVHTFFAAAGYQPSTPTAGPIVEMTKTLEPGVEYHLRKEI